MRRVATISIVVLFLYSARTLPQQTATGAVEGIVVQAATGEPVAGAQVTLYAVSRNSGSGIFLSPPDLVINGPSLAATTPASPGLQLSLPARIPAMTTGSDGKFSFMRPEIGVAFTDQDGHYSIANIPPGDYRVFSWESMDSGFWSGCFLHFIPGSNISGFAVS